MAYSLYKDKCVLQILIIPVFHLIHIQMYILYLFKSIEQSEYLHKLLSLQYLVLINGKNLILLVIILNFKNLDLRQNYFPVLFQEDFLEIQDSILKEFHISYFLHESILFRLNMSLINLYKDRPTCIQYYLLSNNQCANVFLLLHKKLIEF